MGKAVELNSNNPDVRHPSGVEILTQFQQYQMANGRPFPSVQPVDTGISNQERLDNGLDEQEMRRLYDSRFPRGRAAPEPAPEPPEQTPEPDMPS
jgi:hypothetical protein